MQRRPADSAYSKLECQAIAELRWPGEIAGQMHRRCPDLPERDQSGPGKVDRRPKLLDDPVEDVQIGRKVGDAGGIAIPEPQLAIEREHRHQVATMVCLMTPMSSPLEAEV